MIRRTIREHLNKERRLRPQGIKVLSLLFIKEVAKYRRRNPDGSVEKVPYATIFEEEYRRAAKLPEYNTLFKEVDLTHRVEDVHNGYFSIDKEGGWTYSDDETNQTSREHAERAYNLIMKDKEALLSFETPLKFIFSHSALREGWDNPNVLQICTLRDITQERERRQTIGRGLRICVNQDGERVRDPAVNLLTVIARESYEQFAEKLQQEIEADTGFHFGIVEPHAFAAVRATDAAGDTQPLGDAQSKALWESLRASGFIDAMGKIQDALKKALIEGTYECPPAFAAQKEQVISILKKLAGRIEIKNADDGRSIRTRGVMLHSEEFRALWDRIKHKTTYRLSFDNAQLIQDCIEALRDGPSITRTRAKSRRSTSGKDAAVGAFTAMRAATEAGCAMDEFFGSVLTCGRVVTRLGADTHRVATMRS